MYAWIYVADSTLTTDPEKREIDPHPKTCTATELDGEVVPNYSCY